jgi:hypothetical protein
VVILHFSTEAGAIAASGVVGWVRTFDLTFRYEAEQTFRRTTRAVEGLRCRELAQSSGMLIELIMFSAVVMVGVALLVSDPIKRVYPITISRSIGERVSKTLCEATPKPLHAAKENCSIPTVAFEDARDKLPAHNRCVLSRTFVIFEEDVATPNRGMYES